MSKSETKMLISALENSIESAIGWMEMSLESNFDRS